MGIPHRAAPPFAENDLDQHDDWRFETSHGTVYLRVGRKPGAGEPAEAFRPVEPLSRYRTGRAARVSNLSDASSREDVLRVVGEMTADLEGGGAAEWGNAPMVRFLEAYGGFLNGLYGYFANQGERVPGQPDWGLLAALLVAASGYE